MIAPAAICVDLRYARVIYYFATQDWQVWLFTLFGKDQAADLTPDQKRQLRMAIATELQPVNAPDRNRNGNSTMAKSKKRALFGEMMEGVRAMRAHRKGRITLRSHRIEPLALPSIDEAMIRTTRQRLHVGHA